MVRGHCSGCGGRRCNRALGALRQVALVGKRLCEELLRLAIRLVVVVRAVVLIQGRPPARDADLAAVLVNADRFGLASLSTRGGVGLALARRGHATDLAEHGVQPRNPVLDGGHIRRARLVLSKGRHQRTVPQRELHEAGVARAVNAEVQQVHARVLLVKAGRDAVGEPPRAAALHRAAVVHAMQRAAVEGSLNASAVTFDDRPAAQVLPARPSRLRVARCLGQEGRVDGRQQHCKHHRTVSVRVKRARLPRGRRHDEGEFTPRAHGETNDLRCAQLEGLSKGTGGDLAECHQQKHRGAPQHAPVPQVTDGDLEADGARKEDPHEPPENVLHPTLPDVLHTGQRAKA